MSNLVFPSEIGQDVNGANSFGYRLPIKKTPSFKTLVQTPTSNMGEVRVSLTPAPIWIFNLDLAWMRGDFSPSQINSAVQRIVGFFGSVLGQADDWLYFDPWDNGSNLLVVNSGALVSSLNTYTFGVGTGTQTLFPMIRSLGGMADLIQNFVSGFPLVYINGSYTTAYTLTTAGYINFNSAPANGALLTFQGQFYFRCRFLDDEWADLQSIVYQIWSNPQMRFKSVLV